MAAALSAAVVVAGIIVLLLHTRTRRTPPDLVVAVDAIEPVTAGFLVRFTVKNNGGSPAAQATVRGEAAGTGGPEQAEVTFDFVPDGLTRTGGLMFTHDPRSGQLTLRVLGYREP